MLHTYYKRGFLRLLEILECYQVAKDKSVDLALCSKVIYPSEKLDNQLKKIDNEKNVVIQYCKTLLIDLKKPEEDIFSAIHKNTRYKINRAMKRDNLNYQESTSPTNEELMTFCEFYNPFAKQKGIPPANIGKLQKLREQNSLVYTYITDEFGNILCCHMHYAVNHSFVLLYSASGRFDNSEIRNRIGRANRYLHWKDILSSREKGAEWYNFGGLFVDPSSGDTNSINRFKKEFGGIEVDEIKLVYPFSFLGKIITFAYKMKIRKRPEYLRAQLVYQNSHTY